MPAQLHLGKPLAAPGTHLSARSHQGCLGPVPGSPAPAARCHLWAAASAAHDQLFRCTVQTGMPAPRVAGSAGHPSEPLIPHRPAASHPALPAALAGTPAAPPAHHADLQLLLLLLLLLPVAALLPSGLPAPQHPAAWLLLPRLPPAVLLPPGLLPDPQLLPTRHCCCRLQAAHSGVWR